MPLPILPFLMAIPAAATIIHDLFGERPSDNTQKFQELLDLTEVHLSEIQELRLIAEKKLAVAEDRLVQCQTNLAVAGDRLAEAQKKRGWWPWSKGWTELPLHQIPTAYTTPLLLFCGLWLRLWSIGVLTSMRGTRFLPAL